MDLKILRISTALEVTALSSAGHQHRTCFARARARGVGLAAGRSQVAPSLGGNSPHGAGDW